MSIGEHVAQPTRTCFLVPDRFHFGSAMWAASALSQGSLIIFALGMRCRLLAPVGFPSLSNDIGMDGVGFGDGQVRIGKSKLWGVRQAGHALRPMRAAHHDLIPVLVH